MARYERTNEQTPSYISRDRSSLRVTVPLSTEQSTDRVSYHHGMTPEEPEPQTPAEPETPETPEPE